MKKSYTVLRVTRVSNTKQDVTLKLVMKLVTLAEQAECFSSISFLSM